MFETSGGSAVLPQTTTNRTQSGSGKKFTGKGWSILVTCSPAHTYGTYPVLIPASKHNLKTESIEWYKEDHAFLWSYYSAPRPPPSPLSHQQVVPLSQSSSVSPVGLTDGRGGKGMGEEPNHQIIRLRESLALRKSFNTLDGNYSHLYVWKVTVSLSIGIMVSR